MTSGEFLIAFFTILIALSAATVLNIKLVRVAQRVHYLPGEVSRNLRLWVERKPLTLLLWFVAALVGVAGSVIPDVTGSPVWGWFVALGPLAFFLTPWGLPLRGKTSTLAWTARAFRVFGAATVLLLLLGALSVWLVGVAGVLIPLFLAGYVWDLALALMWQVERYLSRGFVADAQRKLQRVGPKVVAITGSYGKTSTKGYVAHLVSATHQTVASPASFNNLMGLSRTINDHLVVGTGVFVAEMGMNQEGRIRELSSLFPPDIAAITIIGEAHMERLGSQEAIFRAKSEITENAPVVVLPVDQPELVALADKCRRQGKTVITVSGQGKPADCVVDPDLGVVRYGPGDGESPMSIPPFGHAVNIAVALGIAWALQVPKDQALHRLGSLPVAAHRAEVQRTQEEVWIIDDTYNSNPVGSQHAVKDAAALAAERGGPLVVVTPGMVELGPVQYQRNFELARTVVEVGGTLMVVGLTNKKALLEGASGAAEVFPGRADAVAAALRAAGDKGVILYENDLPDHYP